MWSTWKPHQDLIFKPGSSQNGRIQEWTRGQGVASENRGIQFKIGELEHMSDDSHEKLSHESDESDDSSE